MSDATIKALGDMEKNGDGFVLARKELGAGSFGMQVGDFPPDYDGYPEHDETGTGQEEIYVVLDGSCVAKLDGEETPLSRLDFVRVGPAVTRAFRAGPDGVKLLALSGTPGKPYEPPAWTQG